MSPGEDGGAIGRRGALCAALVGGVATLGGAANFLMLPHPAWVVAVGMPTFLAAALLGGRIGRGLAR